ncbi:hypothetical protein pipiens_010919, partial [Culex pipiens pipiens]
NWCISLHILLHYLMLVNYFWMFCEGLHLHLVLVIVFIKDAIAMRWFMTIGWVVPLGLISFYATFRNNYTADTEHCWMDESHAMWLLTVPVFLSLAASLVFLVNVVRVLLTKLNSTSPNPAPLGLKKATRATLILIPLFGLQHILLPFRPNKGCDLERYYQVVSAVLISLQGACVSCLFCFANHDVIFAIKCQLSRFIPDLVQHPFRESYNGGQVQTQSRDMMTFRRVGRPCGKSCGTYGQLCAMKRINRCQCLVGFARNRSGACIYHKHCPVNLQDAEFLEFV